MTQAPSGTSITRASADPKRADPAEILVVLPALNEAEYIETCVRSLMRFRRWMSKCRIVVADGGSTDGTQDIVRSLMQEFPNLVLIDNPGRLQSAGVNTAVARFAEPWHRILIRCDVHAIYPADYVFALAEELRTVEAASVVTAMDATGQTGFQRAAAWIADTPLGAGGSAHRGGRKTGYVDHGHHAAFDLKWFRRVGGYDPTVSHNEDAEYDMRVAQAGGKIWLTSRTRVAYMMRPTLRRLWQQYWNYGRGRANTLIKHRVVPRLRQIVPVANIWMLTLSLLVALVTPMALLWPGFYALLLMATSIVAAISLRSVSGLWAGLALGAMHLAWGLGFMRRVIEGSGTMQSRRIQPG